MAVPAWDSALPQVMELNDYTGSFEDNLIQSDPDMGPSKVRRRYTAGVKPLSGVVIMNKTQFGVFKTFYTSTLLSGALRFSWTEPPFHTEPCEMRFTEVPSWTMVGDHYRVSISLEILP